jgi:EAL domain-containing protein (putative c-di-GMP-specific phosphodiesterase class I)/putative methionine-R-sulfoxide reductase with GAF domain
VKNTHRQPDTTLGIAPSTETAFVSELTETQQLYRAVAGPVEPFGLVVDEGPGREGTYCDRLMDGRIPNVIPDTSANRIVRDLPVTRAAQIGAYVGVPLTLSGGRLYGTLCCVSRQPHPRLDERDAKFLHLLAGMISGRVDAMESARRDFAEVQAVLDTENVDIALQPIINLTTRQYRGAEALARFPGSSRRTDEMFALAASAGLGPDLELLCLRLALRHLPDLPEGMYLSVNMSPEGIADPRFTTLLDDRLGLHRLVLEVTEHARVEQYAALHAALAPLRAAGLRLAVDDVGAGYASFRHVLQLTPDIIKIDRSLVDGIAADPALRTIAGNIVLLGLDLHALIVAEGVERSDDLEVLETIGADMAQGYLFARPSTDPADWRAWGVARGRAGQQRRTRRAAAAYEPGVSAARPLKDRFSRCSSATTMQQACDMLVDDLVASGHPLPSIYTLSDRTLRCVSARGYFQVVDGFEIGIGIVGRVAATGRPVLLNDVAAESAFIAAAPGIRAEAAVPVWVDGCIVAVVNAEAHTSLPASTLDVLGAAAAALGDWICAHGGVPPTQPEEKLSRACLDLAGLGDPAAVRRRALEAAVELSGMSSAAIVQCSGTGLIVTDAVGQLAEAVRSWPERELQVMAQWVTPGGSSHVPGGDQTPPSYPFLEDAGIGSLAVHSLRSPGHGTGLLVLLDRRRSCRTAPASRAMLEQLALSTALALNAGSGVAMTNGSPPSRRAVTADRARPAEPRQSV